MSYTTGHFATGDHVYSNDYIMYNAETIQTNNSKPLCVIKYDWNTTHYSYAVLAPSQAVSYESGTVADNINDYLGYNRSDSSVIHSGNYTDHIDYPASASPSNVIPALRFDNLRKAGEAPGETWFVTTDLPIYTIDSNSDFDKVNRYIETGDDSEADNYSDLHPNHVTTDIYFDGESYYNLLIISKPESEVSGEGGCSLSILAHTGNIAQWTITETVNQLLPFNKTGSYSFGQYAVDSVNHFKFELNCMIAGEYREGYYCEVEFNFKNGQIDGNPTITNNTLHTVTLHYGMPDESDYPTDPNNINHTPQPNNYSGANTLTKTYELTEGQLRQLGNFMWSSTFKDNILSIAGNPLENVVSIKAMPIKEIGTTDEAVKIGNVSTNVSGKVVDLADRIEITAGTAYIGRFFDNFIDYTEVVLQIYLPFIGFKSLDNLIYMGRKLRVRYFYDCVLGNVLAELSVWSDEGEWVVMDAYQATCGIDISLASTNRSQIENGFIGNCIGAVSSLVSGNPLGAVNDVFNGMTQQFHSESTGVGNPSLMGALDMSCYIIVKRPKKFDPSENYAHVVGYPCHLYKELSDLKIESPDSDHIKGCYFKVKNFNASDIGIATDTEKEELKSLLEAGVIQYDR